MHAHFSINFMISRSRKLLPFSTKKKKVGRTIFLKLRFNYISTVVEGKQLGDANCMDILWERCELRGYIAAMV